MHPPFELTSPNEQFHKCMLLDCKTCIVEIMSSARMPHRDVAQVGGHIPCRSCEIVVTLRARESCKSSSVISATPMLLFSGSREVVAPTGNGSSHVVWSRSVHCILCVVGASVLTRLLQVCQQQSDVRATCFAALQGMIANNGDAPILRDIGTRVLLEMEASFGSSKTVLKLGKDC